MYFLLIAISFNNNNNIGSQAIPILFIDKETRFVGIVIDRGGTGLRAWTIVRNVIESQGMEFMYELYSPTVKDIEVLRLEKRLDDELYYLRDADHKYSTFPANISSEILPDGQPVPLNDIVVKLGPKPWFKRWERFTERLFGFSFRDSDLPEDDQIRQERQNMFLNMVSSVILS